ncbi:MAG: VOC family protein [Pseudomonadales bacterium]|nr:VOC family protein [Pseudomonadales bacterium]
MFSVLGLDHLVLRTSNSAELIHFYCNVLGCAVAREQPAMGLTQLRAGDSLIDILAVNDALRGELATVNMDHFCLRIEPFDEEMIRAHLSLHNIEGSKVRNVYGAQGKGPAIYITDPDGNAVELKGKAGAS